MESNKSSIKILQQYLHMASNSLMVLKQYMHDFDPQVMLTHYHKNQEWDKQMGMNV